jgi:FixJ family two-component response regulator
LDSAAPTVFIVDPDPATSKLVTDVLEGAHLRCELFRSGREFLASYDESRPGCLVLEQRISDMSGLQLQHRLAARGSILPLVFLLANANVATAVELMRGGAVHVLEKPARALDLLNAIHEAVAVDRQRRVTKQHQTKMLGSMAALTRKEHQVLELIAKGSSTRAIAMELNLSVRAIELRRKRLMEKLDLQTSQELMRFSVLSQVEPSLHSEHSAHNLALV